MLTSLLRTGKEEVACLLTTAAVAWSELLLSLSDQVPNCTGANKVPKIILSHFTAGPCVYHKVVVVLLYTRVYMYRCTQTTRRNRMEQRIYSYIYCVIAMVQMVHCLKPPASSSDIAGRIQITATTTRSLSLHNHCCCSCFYFLSFHVYFPVAVVLFFFYACCCCCCKAHCK